LLPLQRAIGGFRVEKYWGTMSWPRKLSVPSSCDNWLGGNGKIRPFLHLGSKSAGSKHELGHERPWNGSTTVLEPLYTYDALCDPHAVPYLKRQTNHLLNAGLVTEDGAIVRDSRRFQRLVVAESMLRRAEAIRKHREDSIFQVACDQRNDQAFRREAYLSSMSKLRLRMAEKVRRAKQNDP